MFRKNELYSVNSALKMLDGMIHELYSKFNEDMNIFVGDNSSLTCDTLTERKIAMELKLIREIIKVKRVD